MKDWLRVRWQYLCWRIEFWMGGHMRHAYYPVWLRKWLLRFYPKERWGVTPWTHQWRIEHLRNYEADRYRPLPWFIGPHAIGPFVEPYRAVSRWFRTRTGGRSHRCEFTDPERGALHGGKEGAFMNKMFEQFIENISAEIDEEPDNAPHELEKKRVQPLPATVKPGWEMPTRSCRECDAQLHPVAVWEGGEWVLVWDYCDACGDDRDMMTEVEWPFIESLATRMDFERIGFRIE